MGNLYRFGVDTTVADRDAFREILKEEKREYWGYVPKEPIKLRPDQEPEFASYDAFLAYMLDEANGGDIPKFTVEQLEKLSERLKTPTLQVINQLKLLGLEPAPRAFEKHPRGYRSPENKWASCPSHGCSGQDQINGFAGGSQSKIVGKKVARPRLTGKQVKQVTNIYTESGNNSEKEKERQRLALIKEAQAKRDEAEQLLREKEAAFSEKIRAMRRGERLTSRLHAEVLVIEAEKDFKKKFDRCVRFTRICALYKEQIGNVDAIQEGLNKVKNIYEKMMG
jgi:hypothetical protein